MYKYKDAQSAANILLDKSGCPRLANGIAIDVIRVAKEFCRFDYAEIPNLNLGGPILGAFIPTLNVVMVEQNCYEPRKRFTIAHELGHAQLEHDYGAADTLFPMATPMFFRCDDNDIGDSGEGKKRPLAEVLANKFAAYLLMPEDIVRAEWRKDHDLPLCAERLHVSRESLTYRLQNLRLS